MHSTGWTDTFCLHVSVLLQQVRHEWYGTLNTDLEGVSTDRVLIMFKLLSRNSVDHTEWEEEKEQDQAFIHQCCF